MPHEVNSLIQEFTKQGNIFFKKHALIRIIERKISIKEIEEALLRCTIIETNVEEKPLPSYLVLRYTQNKRPLHALVALDKNERYIWIITVYEPDPSKWNDQLTKRK
jgi:hypothetical protein